MDRRSFLRLSALAVSLLFAPIARAVRRGPLSILQGLTDEHSTQISIVVPEAESFSYQVIGGNGPPPVLQQSQISRQDSAWAIDRLVITGLQAHQEYLLIVSDVSGAEIDKRSFYALDRSGQDARFAIVSCINDQMTADEEWKALIADRPDLLFMIGDTTYADQLGGNRKVADPAQLWQRHVETRNTVPFYFSSLLIPTLATWDDHDFGANDANRTYPYAKESRDIFLSFFPQDPSVSSSLLVGPGVSSMFQAFGQNFFLLDDRTYRTEVGAQEPSHWGLAQESWMTEIAKAHPVPSWFFNGSLFFGAYKAGGESVEGQHPESLKRLGKVLAELPQVCVLSSGDVHYSEIMKIEASWLGYSTLEVVSSSIQSIFFPDMDKYLDNPRRLDSMADHNYVLVESKATSLAELNISVSARGAGGKEFFSQQAQIKK